MLRVALAVFTLAAAVAAGANRAHAETVRLRGGTSLEARSVDLQGEVLVLGLEIGGGQGTLRLPLAQVAPADLVRLLAARTKADDAQGHLRIARAALEAGLFAEAVGRAATAAALDPALAPEQVRVEEAVRGTLAAAALAEIELDLRLGRPAAARVRARALLEHGVPVVAPPLEAARARLLLSLSEAALAQAEKGAAKKPAPVAPGAPAVPGPVAAANVAALADAETLTARAREGRERAADPSLPAARREALLGAAATDLLGARRVLLALGATAAPEVLARLEALRALLVATWLDLADLARGLCRLGDALDRVQAALVLEPESERAWELRRWLEADLHAPFPFPSGGPVVVEPGFASPFAPWALGRVFPVVHGPGHHVPGPPPGGGTVRYPGTRR